MELATKSPRWPANAGWAQLCPCPRTETEDEEEEEVPTYQVLQQHCLVRDLRCSSETPTSKRQEERQPCGRSRIQPQYLGAPFGVWHGATLGEERSLLQATCVGMEGHAGEVLARFSAQPRASVSPSVKAQQLPQLLCQAEHARHPLGPLLSHPSWCCPQVLAVPCHPSAAVAQTRLLQESSHRSSAPSSLVTLSEDWITMMGLVRS